MGRGSSKIRAKTYALFHGSPKADIEEFDVEKAGTNTSTYEHFLFFTDSREMADEFSYERIPSPRSSFLYTRGKQGKVYEVDVTMEKPLDMTNPTDQDIKNIVEMSDGLITYDKAKELTVLNNQLLKTCFDLDRIKDYGYDGFIAKMDNKGTKEYAVVSNKQAKIKKKR